MYFWHEFFVVVFFAIFKTFSLTVESRRVLCRPKDLASAEARVDFQPTYAYDWDKFAQCMRACTSLLARLTIKNIYFTFTQVVKKECPMTLLCDVIANCLTCRSHSPQFRRHSVENVKRNLLKHSLPTVCW